MSDGLAYFGIDKNGKFVGNTDLSVFKPGGVAGARQRIKNTSEAAEKLGDGVSIDMGPDGNFLTYGTPYDTQSFVTPKVTDGLANRVREMNEIKQWQAYNKGESELPPINVPLKSKEMSDSEYSALLRKYNTDMQNKAFDLGMAQFPSIDVKLQ